MFSFGNELRSHINLLAAASSQGLLFVGNPHAAELKGLLFFLGSGISIIFSCFLVFILKDIVDAKATGRKLTARPVQLSNVPNSIAVSADGTMLAVNCTHSGMDVLQIYSVASFLTVVNKFI